MRKMFAGLVAAIAVGVVGLTGTPASAAQSNCPGGRICIWNDINYAGSPTGSWTINAIAAQPGGCQQMTGSNYRTASSIYWNGTFLSYSRFTLIGFGSSGTRGINTNGYADSNMLTSPGIASFSNTLITVCVS